MPPLRVKPHSSSRQQFLRDVLDGLQAQPKTLPSKYFYDRRGSRLFDAICNLEEYYLTRTELAVMRQYAAEMAECVGRRCVLIEYGSGSSLKTRLLLDRLRPGTTYVPVDISGEHLDQAAARIAQRYPANFVHPVCADFTQPFKLPVFACGDGRRTVYFPGSTVGNFEPEQAVRVLAGIADLVGGDGGLLIGIDLRKSRAILEAAYNDVRGVTARFNLNLLRRMNRELGADFDLTAFRHRAFFNSEESRIEMHLVSQCNQSVSIDGREISFRKGESIHTENSYKHTLTAFRRLAAEAGWQVERVWCDANELFSVQYLTVSAAL